MAKWSYTLNVSDVFHADLPFTEFRDTVVRRIREAHFYSDDDPELAGLVDELADTDTVSYFDQVWDWFYDWADVNRVWVMTS